MAGTSLRVLHAIHDFLPVAQAGSEIYAFTLVRALLARNHHVTVVCAKYDPSRAHGHVEWRSYAGVTVAEITNNWVASSFEETYDDPLIQSRLESVLHATQPHVVHVHNLLNLTMGLPLAAKRNGAAVVATLHDYTLVCPSGGQRLHTADDHRCETIDSVRCARCFSESPFGARLAFGRLASRRLIAAPLALAARGLRTLLPRTTVAVARMPTVPVSRSEIEARLERARGVFEDVDLFVAPSASIAREFEQLGLPAGKLRVSDYGFECRRPGNLPAETPPHIWSPDMRVPHQRARQVPASHPQSPLRVGFVGTLVHHKGVHVLIDALRLLTRGAVRAIVVGDPGVFPDYSAELRARAAGLDVRFAGPSSREQLPEIYDEIDVLVVPSIWLENSPLVIHEAQMAHVPVVASRIGGIPELVSDEVNGLLVSPGDSVGLARALQRLLDQPELVTRFAEHAPAVKSIDDDAAQWEGVYEELSAAASAGALA